MGYATLLQMPSPLLLGLIYESYFEMRVWGLAPMIMLIYTVALGFAPNQNVNLY